MTLALDQRRFRKLSDDQIARLCDMRRAGMPLRELATLYGVSYDTVHHVLKANGLTRTHRKPGTVPQKPRCAHCGAVLRARRADGRIR